ELAEMSALVGLVAVGVQLLGHGLVRGLAEPFAGVQSYRILGYRVPVAQPLVADLRHFSALENPPRIRRFTRIARLSSGAGPCRKSRAGSALGGARRRKIECVSLF